MHGITSQWVRRFQSLEEGKLIELKFPMLREMTFPREVTALGDKLSWLASQAWFPCRTYQSPQSGNYVFQRIKLVR